MINVPQQRAVEDAGKQSVALALVSRLLRCEQLGRQQGRNH